VQKIGTEIAQEIVGSWMGGEPAQAEQRPADKSELERLRSIDERLLDEEMERMAKRQKIQDRIDELEVEESQQAWSDDSWDAGDDEEEDGDVVDVVEPLPDDQVDAAKAEYDARVLAGMSPEQRAFFEQESS
jgi:hypothetical protein